MVTIFVFISISVCSPEDLSIADNMVFVEGGEFLLGKEGVTSHLVRVKLNSFYISKFETTVEQWELFLKESGIPYQWKGEYYDMREESPFPDSPIGVKWILAIQYANWVSRKYGLEECYVINGQDVEWRREADGYRLPTDAEWEFAARGGNLSIDYEYSGGNDLDEVAWTGWNSDGYAHPVGTKKANELGLYDMSGNTDEWCWDLSEIYPNNTSILLVNPTGPALTSYASKNKDRWRIDRGGSYGTLDEFLLTPYHRTGSYEFGVDAGPGIRLARNAAD